MPFYFLLTLFSVFNLFSINGNSLIYILIFVFVTVSLLPAVSLYIAGKTKLIEDPLDPIGRDKRIALLLMTIFSLFVCKMWYDRHPDLLYLYIFLTITALYLFMLLSSFLLELDWYTAFWGALFGFYLVLLQLGATFSITFLSIIIIIAALNAVSRTDKAENSNTKIFAGFISGATLAIIIGKVMVL